VGLLRIAIITPEFLPNWGGIGTYVYHLAKFMPSEFEIHVITLSRDAPASSSGEPTTSPVAQVHRIGKAKDQALYNGQFQIDLYRNIRRLQRTYGFDLVHANHAQMPDLLVRLLGSEIPTLTTVHTTIESQRLGTRDSGLPLRSLDRSEKMTYLLLPILGAVEKAYFSKHSPIIFVSSYIRGMYQHRYPLPTRSAVINNGVDVDTFKPRSRQECQKHFPQLEGKDGIVLFSGRLIGLKGISTLIDAFSKCAKDIGKTLVLAGPGNKELWEHRLMERGVPKGSYVFLGSVPYQKMPFLYTLADAFVLPSLSESFPMTVLEAMSCGIPVIASKVGGIPEMVTHGKDGFLTTPGNADELASAMRLISREREKALQMGACAREKVSTRFTAQEMALRTSIFYREALEAAR
jgi:L-malate glycosyltransferase